VSKVDTAEIDELFPAADHFLVDLLAVRMILERKDLQKSERDVVLKAARGESVSSLTKMDQAPPGITYQTPKNLAPSPAQTTPR
jgi:hypothetical protein